MPGGTSQTIELQLCSDGATDPITVEAKDLDVTAISFAWETTTGINGDKLHFTITANEASSGLPDAVAVSTKIGTTTHHWLGVVDAVAPLRAGSASPVGLAVTFTAADELRRTCPAVSLERVEPEHEFPAQRVGERPTERRVGAAPIDRDTCLREARDLQRPPPRAHRSRRRGSRGPSQALCCVDRATGEDQIERAPGSDDLREAHGAAVDERHAPAPLEAAEHRASAARSSRAPRLATPRVDGTMTRARGRPPPPMRVPILYLVCLLAACGGEPESRAIVCGQPERVSITGYDGDAMEPYLSADGELLQRRRAFDLRRDARLTRHRLPGARAPGVDHRLRRRPHHLGRWKRALLHRKDADRFHIYRVLRE